VTVPSPPPNPAQGKKPDEGTAVFKVSNAPPSSGRFVTCDGLSTDRYSRLTGEGTKLIRGERTNQKTIPLDP
jgi:hypothetical protein